MADAVERVMERKRQKHIEWMRELYRQGKLMKYIARHPGILSWLGVYINEDKINAVRVTELQADFYLDSVIVTVSIEWKDSNHSYCERLLELSDEHELCVYIKPLQTECGC